MLLQYTPVHIRFYEYRYDYCYNGDFPCGLCMRCRFDNVICCGMRNEHLPLSVHAIFGRCVRCDLGRMKWNISYVHLMIDYHVRPVQYTYCAPQ